MLTALNPPSVLSVTTTTAVETAAQPRSDLDLMADLGQGDEEAFEVLIARHQTGLINFFFRLVWDRALAEDLAQEVFLKLYLHAGEYQPRAKFTTYLYQIGRNCWIDHLRRTKGERRNVSLDARDAEGHSLAETLPLRREDPRATAGKRELTEILIEAIDNLPEPHKLVVVLSEVQGLSYAEIGEVVGIPVGTVKSRMFHAVQRLKERLARALRGNHGPWQEAAREETTGWTDELRADTGRVDSAGAGRVDRLGARHGPRPPGSVRRLPGRTGVAPRRLASRPRDPAA